MTSFRNNNDKIAVYINECRRMGIEVLPPDVNESFANFTVVEEGIRFGLAAVKNVGYKAVRAIVRERKENGPYRSLRDICERVDARKLNRRALESLIKAGALGSLGARRSQMLTVLEKTLKAAQTLQRKRRQGQVTFFDDASDDGPLGAREEELPDLEEFPDERLLSMEKETLGLYLSGHPLDEFEAYLRPQIDHSFSELPNLPDGVEITVGGLIREVKRVTTKRGSSMAFVELEDFDGEGEVLLFPDRLRENRDEIEEGRVVVVEGQVSWRDEEVNVEAQKVRAVEKKPVVVIQISAPRRSSQGENYDILYRIKDVLSQKSGDSPVYLAFSGSERAVLTAPQMWVEWDESLSQELKKLSGVLSCRAL